MELNAEKVQWFDCMYCAYSRFEYGPGQENWWNAIKSACTYPEDSKTIKILGYPCRAIWISKCPNHKLPAFIYVPGHFPVDLRLKVVLVAENSLQVSR